MSIINKEKVLAYYNINKCKSNKYEFKDQINGYDGILDNFPSLNFINDENDKYINLHTGGEIIYINNIPQSNIKGIIANI